MKKMSVAIGFTDKRHHVDIQISDANLEVSYQLKIKKSALDANLRLIKMFNELNSDGTLLTDANKIKQICDNRTKVLFFYPNNDSMNLGLKYHEAYITLSGQIMVKFISLLESMLQEE